MDYNVKPKVKPDGSGVVTDGVNMIVNPFDEIAVEESLKLKEKNGGEVVVLSIGTKDTTTQIRAALAMGADRGILVLADGSVDPDAAARLIKAVYEQEKPDLVVLGKQAIDDDSSQAGQLLAEYLGLPQATFASKVDVAGKTVTVTREVDGGLETISFDMPGVVTADLRLNTPRYASLPGIMKAKKKEVKEFTPAALGVDIAPKVKVLKLEEPKARQAGQKVPDVATLVGKLRNEAKAL
ncbi:MAG: electron transfer flavoprotein subunit beta/FixA family protein [Deltaproteobacteria bacterium]|nr:electron transfer flavoprotein subunit beta/FixA family protein [Deltaproteobacteria bacterium]